MKQFDSICCFFVPRKKIQDRGHAHEIFANISYIELNPLFLNNQRSECVRMNGNEQVTMLTFSEDRMSWTKSSSTQLLMADTSTILDLTPKEAEFGGLF